MKYLQFTSLLARRAHSSARRRAHSSARRGATALEYALVLAFVAVGVVAALNTLSTDVQSSITSVGTKVKGAPASIK